MSGWDRSDDVSAFTEDAIFGALLQRVAGDSGPSDRQLIETVAAQYADHPRFRLLEPLGVGGFGVVFLAEDRRLSDRVALKVLHAVNSGAIYRFKQEFRLLQQVIHPGLIRLFQLYCEAGRWFFTMEWVPGWDLFRARGERSALEPQLSQLAKALMYLHDQGLLHLDLKPSNVRVTERGRVVILDFGLARVSADAANVRAGTPGYMAPEQRDGGPVSPATDWYAVGVMLFQALAGRDPRPQDPWFDRVDRADEEDSRLVTLCRGLLAVDPSDRPDVERIAELLGLEPPARPAPAVLKPLSGSRAARLGAGTVIAYGSDGPGNDRWLARLAAELSSSGALVLRSRCRVQESIAFRAFDELVDGLARALNALEPAARQALMPQDTSALASLFPTFPGSIDPGSQPTERVDTPELRRRAFFAFRELLGHLSRSRRVALLIDDVQWMDVDSVLPLLGLADPPVSLPVLLVVACRTQGNDWVTSLGPAAPLLRWAPDPLVLPIDGERSLPDDESHQALVGSPALIRAHAAALALVAAAPQPLELGVAQRALEGGDFPALVTAGLLRWAAGDRLEFASPAQAAAARQQLSDSVLQQAHLNLAAALDSEVDPVRRAMHLEAGGRSNEAGNCLLEASDEAFGAGDYQVACHGYRALDALKLDWSGCDRDWRWRWAQSLARVGHCQQAGSLARSLAPRFTADHRAAVSLDAAQWLLASGQVEAGLQVAAEVLDPLGVRLPTSRSGRMLAFVAAKARSRGPIPPLASPAEVSEEHRRATDACWTLGLRVASMDLLQGAHLLFHHLDLAASGGDAGGYGRGLAVEGVLRSVLGGADAETLLQQAELPVRASGDPRARGGLLLARAMAHVFAGAFPDALDACERAEPFFAVSGREGVQDGVLLQGLRQLALYWTGRLNELRSVYLRDADLHRFRGDLFARVHLTTQFGWLAPIWVDDPDRALSLLEEASDVWSVQGYQTQHLTLTIARVNALLYAERLDEASAMVADQRSAVRNSGLLLVPAHQLRWNGLRCRVLLASLEAGSREKSALKELESRLHPRRWQGVPWVGGLRLMMLGRLEARQGDTQRAVRSLIAGEEELRSHGLQAACQAARWRRGHLLGDEAGRELVASSEGFFSGQGCARPDRLARWMG